MPKTTVLAAVAASIIATTSVFAQDASSGSVPAAPPARGDFRDAGRIQERIRAAHDRLGITPAQQPQWDALVAVLRDNARSMRASPAVQSLRSGQLAGLQELRVLADVERQRADAVQRTIPAVEALYAVLSPEQRQIADRDINHLMQPGRGRHG